MKKIYTLIAAVCLTASAANAQQVWDNFQNTRVADYDFVNGVFIPYFENPDQEGANPSQVAAQYTRNGAELFDVIVMQGVMDDVTDYATGSKTMSIDVWSPEAGKTVQITLENTNLAEPDNYPIGRHSEYLATTTVSEEWETLTFSLSATPDGNVSPSILNQLVILFDPNTNNQDTYYWDNFNGPELANPPCEDATPDPLVLNDFECNQNVNYIFSHSGINFRRIPNPDMTGNESSHVATYTRNGGEENDVLIGTFPDGIDIEDDASITLDVWDPAAPTTVIVSLQNAEGDVILEMTAETSESETWQTLSYDPSSVAGAGDIEQFVILFDPESDTSDEYFFDNFILDQTVNVEDLETVGHFNVFPNPSAGQTTFEYDLVNGADVQLAIFDLTGKVIDQKNLGNQAAGRNQYVWNPNGLTNGLYFYTFTVNGQTASGKIVLNK
ncbi:MAG: T9SS type A sorting domain-containing protein [Flavobacteriales bacterium]|nr:T9SS type A sorting domain-containing protein [Flavobacteriales bacterium]